MQKRAPDQKTFRNFRDLTSDSASRQECYRSLNDSAESDDHQQSASCGGVGRAALESLRLMKMALPYAADSWMCRVEAGNYACKGNQTVGRESRVKLSLQARVSGEIKCHVTSVGKSRVGKAQVALAVC